MDTWALGNAAARALMQEGGNTWFFIAFDYALGAALERDATGVLTSLGGKVLGSVDAPARHHGFFLLSAAGAVVRRQGGRARRYRRRTWSTRVKQAAEFGLTKHQMLAGLFTQIVDVDSIGLKDAQGLLVTEAFYWDLNDKTRAFSKRFAERFGGRVPTANQAGVYSSVLAYLHAVKAANTIEGEKVVAQMRQRADRGRAVRHRHGPPGRARGARHVRVPGQEAGASPRAAGTITSWSRPSRPRRRSGRSTRAAARWFIERGCPLVH